MPGKRPPIVWGPLLQDQSRSAEPAGCILPRIGHVRALRYAARSDTVDAGEGQPGPVVCGLGFLKRWVLLAGSGAGLRCWPGVDVAAE